MATSRRANRLEQAMHHDVHLPKDRAVAKDDKEVAGRFPGAGDVVTRGAFKTIRQPDEIGSNKEKKRAVGQANSRAAIEPRPQQNDLDAGGVIERISQHLWRSRVEELHFAILQRVRL